MPLQTGFSHNVFFWLRDSGDAADASRLADSRAAHLTGIPGVLRLTVGSPAGTDRGVVDNSYGVALLVENADAAAHGAVGGLRLAENTCRLPTTTRRIIPRQFYAKTTTK